MNCEKTSRQIVYELDDHSGPGYRLEINFSHSSAGTTLDFYTVWPGARVPDPHRKLSLTLPPEAISKLASLIAEQATCNHFVG